MSNKKPYFLWMLGLTLLALLWRSLHPHGFRLEGDSGSYIGGALAFLMGKWELLPLSRTPGYPLLLAPHLALYSLFYGKLHDETIGFQFIVITQTLLTFLTAFLMSDLTLRLWGKRWLSLLTYLLIACLPSLVFYECAILSETLYTFGLVLSLWLSYFCFNAPSRKDSFLYSGLAWVITAMVRPIGFFPLAMAGIILALKQGWRAAIRFALPFILVVGLWVGHNVQTCNYWGIAEGASFNQLLTFVDLIDFKSAPEQPYKRAIEASYRTYAPTDPERYLAVNYGLHKAYGVQQADNATWLRFNQTARALVQEIWQTRPVDAMLKIAHDIGLSLWQPFEWEWPVWWPALLGISLLTLLGLIVRDVGPYRAFYGVVLLTVLSQLLAYPFLVFWQPRFRAPLEPILLPFFLFGFWQAITWVKHRFCPAIKLVFDS